MSKMTKEQKAEMHKAMCDGYEEKGYVSRDNTVSALKGNVLGTIIPIPMMLILFAAATILCLWLYPEKELEYNPILFFVYLIAFILLHELTHGFFAAIRCENGWKSVKFGFNVEGLNPYCTCREPLKLKYYRQVLLAPMIVEGIVPVIIGSLIGSFTLIVLGCFMFWAAGGDMLIYIMTMKENKDTLVLDHPYLIGCTLFMKQSEE